MKYLRLIWRNASRNRRRAVLTVLSISIAIAAIAILQTIIVAFHAGVEVAQEARLVTRSKTSLIFPLPVAFGSKIAAVPGVRAVSSGTWFGGNYQDKKNMFPKFAIDAEKYFPMYLEYGIPPDQYQAFLADRKGCVVGRKLAAKYGFKLGDPLPIIGTIYPGDWQFNVRAIYEGLKPAADETAMFFHWKYLEESLPLRRQGLVGWYMVQVQDGREAGRIAKAIDAEFENSPDQTLSETEKEFQLGFVKMMGNFELLVRVIGSAVAFALMLVAGNTMAMAARERTTEIAILKTIGYRKSHLASLIVAEALLLVLTGWAVGCGGAYAVCKGVEAAFPTYFPVFPLKPMTVAIALAVAVFTGAISGLFPALQAARISIVDAMRKIA